MAISRKPKAPIIDVDALINKGGSVAQPSANASTALEKPVSVVLRIPADILAKVDELVEARRVKTPRHTWLIEAVVDKLERES